MPDQTKKHTTITISVKTFDNLFPCESGLKNAKPFLPAKLSTDPHANLELADKWVRSDRPWDLTWLAEKLGVTLESYPDSEYTIADVPDGGLGLYIDYGIDAWVMAQQLAIIADVVATMEGR